MSNERDVYARLAEGFSPRLVPTVAEQEADAEALPLPGAAHVVLPANPSQGVGPVVDDTVHVESERGSDQVPTGGAAPLAQTQTADEKHLHYWVHTVTETVERGSYGRDTERIDLVEGHPMRLFGLDDLRTRGYVKVRTIAEDTVVYIGTRDLMNSADPTQGFPLLSVGDQYEDRAREECWAIAVGGAACVHTVSFKSEPTSSTLGQMENDRTGSKAQ